MANSNKLGLVFENSKIGRIAASSRKSSTMLSVLQGVNQKLSLKAGPLLSRFSRIIRSSYLYQWLTKEPDPEVIIIDLRETYTVGPMISVINIFTDLFIGFAYPYWNDSVCKRFVENLDVMNKWTGESLVVGWILTLLKPPENLQSERMEK